MERKPVENILKSAGAVCTAPHSGDTKPKVIVLCLICCDEVFIQNCEYSPKNCTEMAFTSKVSIANVDFLNNHFFQHQVMNTDVLAV